MPPYGQFGPLQKGVMGYHIVRKGEHMLPLSPPQRGSAESLIQGSTRSLVETNQSRHSWSPRR